MLNQDNNIENTNNSLIKINENQYNDNEDKGVTVFNSTKHINHIHVLTNHYGISIEDIDRSDLSKNQKDVLLATLKFPQIQTLDIQQGTESYKELIGIIGKTIWESGITITEDEQLILIPYIVNEIKDEFPTLTIEDIKIAFKKGVRKDYGDFFGINMTTINVWIKSYISITKKDALSGLSHQIKLLGEHKTINLDQIRILKERWLNSFVELFDKYKNKEEITIIDAGNVFYKYCIKHNIGSLTDEQKEMLEAKAKRVVIAKENENARSKYEKKEFKNIVNAIVKDIYDYKVSNKILSEAKRLAITVFFDKLIEDKLELKDLIDSIEKNNKI